VKVKHEEFRKKVLSRPGARERVAALKTSILRDQALEELRHTHKITQQDLGDVMGLSQKRVSQLEHQDDARVSTVRAYIEALGGQLQILAVFDGESIPVKIGR
jgi:DNA-binding XRE family transcriptional regulator